MQEQIRFVEARANTTAWKQFAPCLPERQWGAVREDYSAHGAVWNYITHDMALELAQTTHVYQEMASKFLLLRAE